jgi:dipeptidyl aminopeptidase/acylaminoacyl peptidase
MKNLLMFVAVIFSFQALAQKKVLDHTSFDSWEAIKEVSLHPNGIFVVYVIAPQEGDGNLLIRNKLTNKEIAIPRGTQGVFTEDGQFFIAKIRPSFAALRKAKIDKKKAEEMPKDSLVIVTLTTGELIKMDSVKSFQIPKFGNGVVAYLKDPKVDINKEGATLYFRDLTNNKERAFNNISQYAMHPDGLGMAMYKVKTKGTEAQVLLCTVADTNTKILSNKFNAVTSLTWDEHGKQLAYLIEQDSVNKVLQKNYSLAYYNPELDTAINVITRQHPMLPLNYTIGGDKKISFSKSGTIIELGIQPILPIKDTSLPEFERVSVDIWHYADPLLQPMQLKNVEASLKSTETILFSPINKSIVYLGKINERNLIQTKEGDGLFTYATIDSNYSIESQWQGFSKKDIYVINNTTAAKTLIQKNVKMGTSTASYDGNLYVYYIEDQKKIYVYNALTGTKKEILKDIPFPLYDEENDVPDDPNAYGIAKWLSNNSQFLIYDKYDIWLADATGVLPSFNLTNGRKTKTVYRFVETDMERKTLPTDATILLKSFNEVDKSEGIVSLQLNTKKVVVINQFPMHLTTIVAAKNTNDFVMLQEDEKQSPNLYSYNLDTTKQQPKAFTNINKQQENFNWLKSQLVTWKAYTGKTAEGILYLPENFEATKKYPMIVYFYERNNQTLHNYLPPAPTPSRLNIPFFVSRGYIVFVPDIWYKKGYPGQGAYDYIVSGTRAMLQKGFIDSTKLGLQGQSWGGYQIAHLITKTNLYAAAWAGAPVVNMTSAYGGIRWGTGMNRQFQYEKTQSRIGATLWERPDLYIKNSPLFELPKVTTPLVIMSNDGDDAVPWYQGIEMFTAMRRLNKKVWLLNYNNEAHNLVERKNRKDIQIREQQFFDSYLKGAPMPTWLSNGVPAIMKGRDLGLN